MVSEYLKTHFRNNRVLFVLMVCYCVQGEEKIKKEGKSSPFLKTDKT